jgi:uncharacterized glyoxalase superfamily protein PhnB
VDVGAESMSRRRDDASMTRVEPELWVGDPTMAIEFYVRAFGARVVHRVGQGNEIVAQLAVGDARFWSRIRGASASIQSSSAGPPVAPCW